MGKNKMRDITCGMKGDYQFWESANANSIAEQYYLSRLSELAMSMFKWKNMPDSIDVRFLEYTLFYEGAAVFFKDDDLVSFGGTANRVLSEQNKDDGTYLALQVVLGGNLNVYRVPNDRKAYAVNTYNKQLTAEDSVIIWNNENIRRM